MPQLDFERFFDLSLDMLAVASPEGRFIRVNAAFQRCLGWDEATLTGQPFATLIHPDDRQATEREIAKLISGAPSHPFANRYRAADGAYRTIQWATTRDEASGMLFAIGRDITEMRQTEVDLRTALIREMQAINALRLSENRLAEAQRLAQIGSWQLDLASRKLWWSPEIYSVFELEPGRSGATYDAFLELVHPEDREAVRQAFNGAVVERSPYEIVHRLLMPDGRVKYVHERARILYDAWSTPLRAIGTMQEVTRWKAAEAALAESNARFEAALEGVAAGFFILDREWRFRYINTAGARLLRSSKEQLLGQVIWELFPVLVDTRFYTVYHQVMETRRPMMVLEHLPQFDLWYEAFVSPYIGGIAVFALDVSERKRAEEALRLKDQVIISSLNAVVVTDANGVISYVNPAFLRLWGFASEDEVLGRTPFELSPEPDSIQEVIAQLRLHGAWQGELHARRADGSAFDVIVSANTVLDADGKVVNIVGSFLDISEAKRLQAQLLQAQKMESVGRLAGGVAHDFNNLLTVIKGYVDLAALELSPGDPLHYDLGQVTKAAESAAELTQQLLAFSRQQIIAPQAISLNDVIARVERMLQRVIGEDIELYTIMAAGLPSVLFDPGQCEQIILNLAINARDAMPGGGKLTIETAQLRLDEEYARVHAGVRPGDYVLLAVSDTGLGMSNEVRAHIFEPFFTTKELGKGTGLGLAMVYGAVSQNGGRIEVYSEPGQGTTFKLYLPRADGPNAPPRPEPDEELPRGSETILLVEDDDAVRALAIQMLEQQSYRVHAFGAGAEALRALGELAEPIDLLITDVVMPGLNGRTLADRVKELRPAIKVLFTSGYTANVIVHHGVLKEGVEFLPKPYTLKSLARRVRDLLDKNDLSP
jgi:two-component system cell cycle sensor histidine kinase/response regulator CckA